MQIKKNKENRAVYCGFGESTQDYCDWSCCRPKEGRGHLEIDLIMWLKTGC